MRIIQKKVLTVLLSMVMATTMLVGAPLTAGALPASIDISTLGATNVISPAGDDAWNYDASSKTLNLTAVGGNYTLTGTNSDLSVSVSNVGLNNVDVTLNNTEFSNLGVSCNCTVTLIGTNSLRYVGVTSDRSLTITGGIGGNLTVSTDIAKTNQYAIRLSSNSELRVSGNADVTVLSLGEIGDAIDCPNSSACTISVGTNAKLSATADRNGIYGYYSTHLFLNVDGIFEVTALSSYGIAFGMGSASLLITGTGTVVAEASQRGIEAGILDITDCNVVAKGTGTGSSSLGPRGMAIVVLDDPRIFMNDAAKLTIIRNGSVDENHSFICSNSLSTLIWKLTPETVLSSGTLTDSYIEVTIPVNSTCTVEREPIVPAISMTSAGLGSLRVGVPVMGSVIYTLRHDTYVTLPTLGDFTVSGLPAGLSAGTPVRTSDTVITIPITGTPTTYNASSVTLGYAASIPSANMTSNTALTPTGTVTASAVAKGTLVIGDLANTIPAAHVYSGVAQGIGSVTCAKAGAATITVKYNTVATAPTNAGTYAVIVDVAESANYAAATFSLGNYTIARKDLSEVTINANFGTITYNGSAQTPTPISVTFDGAAVAVTTSYTLGGWASNINAGTNTASVVFTGAGNYIGTKTVNFSIGAKPLTLIADNKTIVVGEAEPAYTYTVVGLVGSDTAGFTTQPALSVTGFSSAAPATFPIAITGGAISNTNYTIGTYTNGTLTVTDKTIVTISGVTVANKTYNGVAVAPSGTPVVTGSTGNHLALVYTYTKLSDMSTSTTAPKDAGYYTLVVSTAASDPNYFGESAPISFSIAKATITITADNKTAITGAALPAFTYTVSGLVSGETLATNPTVTCPTANMNTAGNYPIVANGAVAPAGDNYNAIVYNNGTLTVTAPVPPTITSANSFSCVTGIGGSFPLTATGTSPITFSLSGTVPAGVSISGSTLVVAGSVPTGDYSFVIVASNATQSDASQQFTLNMTAADTGGSNLPATGDSTIVMLLGALMVAALGTGAVFAYRRRRQDGA